MERLGRRLILELMAGILLAPCLGFAAGSSHKPPERATDVTFSSKMILQNGKTLPAGTYRMEVPEDSNTPVVTFLKSGKVMATTHAKLQSQDKKNPYTEVRSLAQGNEQRIIEIRPGGWNEVLKFGPAS